MSRRRTGSTECGLSYYRPKMEQKRAAWRHEVSSQGLAVTWRISSYLRLSSIQTTSRAYEVFEKNRNLSGSDFFMGLCVWEKLRSSREVDGMCGCFRVSDGIGGYEVECVAGGGSKSAQIEIVTAGNDRGCPIKTCTASARILSGFYLCDRWCCLSGKNRDAVYRSWFVGVQFQHGGIIRHSGQ